MEDDWEGRQRERIGQAIAHGNLLHVTHGDCLDGMSAVGLVRRAFPGAVWLGIRPDETARALAWIRDALTAQAPTPRARLLVTDVSLQGGDASGFASTSAGAVSDSNARSSGASASRMLAEIARHADIVWLDHHEPQWTPSAEETLAGLARHVRIDRTGTECAATLTLDWLEKLPREPMGTFRLDARDLFTEADRTAMRAVAHRDTFSDPDDPQGIRFGLTSSRLRADYASLVEHGQYKAIELLSETPWRKRRTDLRDALTRIQTDGAGVAWIFGPAPLSDLAHSYWPDHDARILLHFTDDGRVRIRSRPGFPHAHRLARQHGGGGHAHAAGAPLVQGSRWRHRMYRTLGRHDPKVHAILRQARMLALVPQGTRKPRAWRTPPPVGQQPS